MYFYYPHLQSRKLRYRKGNLPRATQQDLASVYPVHLMLGDGENSCPFLGLLPDGFLHPCYTRAAGTRRECVSGEDERHSENWSERETALGRGPGCTTRCAETVGERCLTVLVGALGARK